MTYEKYLKSIYYDPRHPASFSGVDKLYRAVRKDGKYVLGKAKVKAWLLKQEPYTLHRHVIRKQKRQKIVVPYIDYQWEADVAYMTPYSKENDGYGYFLLVIDVFSKFVWTFPLKHVRGYDVARAFEQIGKDGRRPEKLRSDMGSEFKSSIFEKLLKSKGIEHFYSLNETKAAVAERAIKTIKSRIARYMTTKQTHRWIDNLNDITESYNRTYHRSLKRAPREVKPRDEGEIWQSRYNNLSKKSKREQLPATTKFRFRVGDHVRISHLRRPFQRE
ncbi:MAG: transposase family protein [Candidatus Thiodiazotropha sp.]